MNEYNEDWNQTQNKDYFKIKQYFMSSLGSKINNPFSRKIWNYVEHN